MFFQKFTVSHGPWNLFHDIQFEKHSLLYETDPHQLYTLRKWNPNLVLYVFTQNAKRLYDPLISQLLLHHLMRVNLLKQYLSTTILESNPDKKWGGQLI